MYSPNEVPSSRTDTFTRVSFWQNLLPCLFLVLLVIAKLIYVFDFRIDSDETQHLHVVWGWTQGWLPYRDFFDNHSPLFQLLCVPLFRAIGERANIVIPMRFAMVPLYLLCLWCVYLCGRNLFSRQVGLWAAVCAGAWPKFFTCSTEFRTDDLWAVFWLLAIVSLTARRFRYRHAFFLGLALGAGFATSMKTSALVVSMMAGALIVLVDDLVRGRSIPWRHFCASGVLVLLGLAVVPACLIAFFAVHHALPNLYYGTIQYNLLNGLAKGWDLRKRIPVLLIAVAVSLCGYLTYRQKPDSSSYRLVGFITLTTFVYLLLIGVYWPLVEPEDFLPIAPLVILLVLGAAHMLPVRSSLFPPVFAAFEILGLFVLYPPKAHATADKIELISNVLRLTSKQDFVMDGKGETIFRRRPFYYALEAITRRRIQLKLIKNDIPERLIATRTPVAILMRMPVRARRFIEENYVPVGFRILVLGKVLTPSTDDSRVYRFDIAIPARYTLCATPNQASGTLDGGSLEGPHFLRAGQHEARITSDVSRLAILWSNAVERGFSPFVALKNDPHDSSD